MNKSTRKSAPSEDATENNMIYLDHEQCAYFKLPYFDRSGAKWVIASEILSSKSQGYDKHHQSILAPLGELPMLIYRDEQTCPGWYNVTS